MEKQKLDFINAAKCKAYALHVAGTGIRYHKFTRVSRRFLENINDKVRSMICNEVTDAPSKGKTL